MMAAVAPHLVLVRHAATQPDPDRPARDWPLTDDGGRAAEALAARLADRRIGRVISSDEPKAAATAAPIAVARGLTVTHDDRLREADRPWLEDGYDEAAARWLDGDPLDGWELLDAVRSRMWDATRARDADLVAVTHGLALTALVTAIDPAIDGPSFWRALLFPDVVVVDGGRVGKPG